jgi:hypothetical protein
MVELFNSLFETERLSSTQNFIASISRIRSRDTRLRRLKRIDRSRKSLRNTDRLRRGTWPRIDFKISERNPDFESEHKSTSFRYVEPSIFSLSVGHLWLFMFDRSLYMARRLLRLQSLPDISDRRLRRTRRFPQRIISRRLTLSSKSGDECGILYSPSVLDFMGTSGPLK